MSLSDLHEQVLADYRDFVRSFIRIADERARVFVQRALAEQGQPLARVAGPAQARLMPWLPWWTSWPGRW